MSSLLCLEPVCAFLGFFLYYFAVYLKSVNGTEHCSALCWVYVCYCLFLIPGRPCDKLWHVSLQGNSFCFFYRGTFSRNSVTRPRPERTLVTGILNLPKRPVVLYWLVLSWSCVTYSTYDWLNTFYVKVFLNFTKPNRGPFVSTNKVHFIFNA